MENCQKIVHPLQKGAQDYGCRRQHYKDGWCIQHHPEKLAAKEKKHAERLARQEAEKELQTREMAAQRLFDLAQLEKGGLTRDGLGGLTLLDYFAAKALNGVIMMPDECWPFDFSEEYGSDTTESDHLALAAYTIGEAMLRARQHKYFATQKEVDNGKHNLF